MKVIVASLLLAVPTVAMGQSLVFTGSPSKKEVTYRAYPGPPRSPEQTAVVYFGGRAFCSGTHEGQCGSHQGLTIKQIDGRPDIEARNWDGTLRETCKQDKSRAIHCKHPVNSIQLEPGCHYLTFDSSLLWEVSRQTVLDPPLFSRVMM